MPSIKLPNPEYIVSESGEKKFVVLPIKDYENLIEELLDLADIAERRDEPVKSHSDFVAELKNDGYL